MDPAQGIAGGGLWQSGKIGRPGILGFESFVDVIVGGEPSGAL